MNSKLTKRMRREINKQMHARIKDAMDFLYNAPFMVRCKYAFFIILRIDIVDNSQMKINSTK